MESVPTSVVQSNPQRVFSWKAPLRAYKKQGKSTLRFFAALAVLLCLVTLFFGDWVLVIPILTVLFLFYVLTVTPPPEVENIITTFGIESAGVSIRWEILSHFYFTKKFGYNVLTLVSHGPYYYHAYFIAPNDEIKRQVVNILSKHIMFMEKPQLNFTDKVIDWLAKLMPDDEEPSKTPVPVPQTRIPASL